MSIATELHREAVIHVRFAGRSVDLPWAAVDGSRISTDGQVRRAVAVALDVPAADLAGYAVDRHTNGNLTVRPPAVFG